MTLPFDIKRLIGEATAYDKKETLELKKVKSWCKSISAFANGSGGKLVFGIEDSTDRIVGVESPQQMADKFSEIVKERLDPLPEINLTFETIDDKHLLVAEVKPGMTTPYYYRGDGQMTALCVWATRAFLPM